MKHKKTKDFLKERIKTINRVLKTRKKQMLALVLAILTFCSTFTTAVPAFALSIGDKDTFTRTWVSGVYFKTGTWTDGAGNTHYDHSGQLNILNLKSTGEPVYCLQPDISVDLNKNATANDFKKTTAWQDLSRTASIIVTRASIYGYPTSTYGYSAQAAQAATHLIIWDAIIGKRSNYTHLTDSYSNSCITQCTADVKNCYNAILDAMSEHTSTPSFNKTSVTLNGTGKTNGETITDTKGLLGNFNVSSTNSNIKAEKSGNNVTVYCTASGNYSGNIVLTKKNTDIGSALALTGADQTVLYGKIADPITVPLRVKVEALKGKVRVKKVDPTTNANISGATLVVKELSVDANGNKTYINPKTLTYNSSTGYYESDWFYVTDANSGWFQIVETKAPNGYLATNKYENFSSNDVAMTGRAGAFQITESNNNKTATITLKEDPVTAKVKFQKFWAHTDRNGDLLDKDNNFINEAHLLKDQTILDSLNLEVRQYNKDTNKFDPTGIPIVFDEETGYFEAQGLTYTSQNSIINWYYTLI